MNSSDEHMKHRQAYLEVLDPGPQTSVQDSGRFGVQALGMCNVQAADQRLLRLANALVGNADAFSPSPIKSSNNSTFHNNTDIEARAACLEISLKGPGLRLIAPEGAGLLVALAGECKIELDGVPLPAFQSFWLKPNQTLNIGPCMGVTSYAYLGVSGGIQTPLLYGSRSTHLKSGMGGYEGRQLVKSDRLPIQVCPSRASEQFPALVIPKKYWLPLLEPRSKFDFVLGPQAHAFDKSVLHDFLQASYKVTSSKDRMGARLQGLALKHKSSADILSDPIALGAIQIPGDGQPIVLLSERQTLGGYSKIGTVLSNQVPALAQLKPGIELRFQAVSAQEAITKVRQAEQDLLNIIKSMEVAKPKISLDVLMSHNLISGAVAS